MVTVGLESSLTNTGINSWQFSVTLEETLKEQNGHPLKNTLEILTAGASAWDQNYSYPSVRL